MKKTAFFLFFIFILLAKPLGLSAQTPTIQEAQTSSPSKTSTKLILERLEAAVFRLEKISEKTSSRVAKIKKEGKKVSRLESQVRGLTRQINSLKEELVKVNELGVSTKSYPNFRKQVVSLARRLKQILALEKTIIEEMRQSQPKTATPTAVIIR